MSALLDFSADASYAERTQALCAHGFAVWDVVYRCARPGSLDADIDVHSLQANDFRQFFAAHPHIRRVFFNGASAERFFRQHASPQLAAASELPNLPALQLCRLPSTSPAHASLRLPEKLAAWRALLP